MPSKLSIDQVRASNATATWSYRPTAVFVGGTSGIGEATAKAFAQATKGFAHIIIIGRSRSRGEAIIKTLPKTTDSKYEFVSCDVTDMQNIANTSKELKEKLNITKINYLALSQGGNPLLPDHPGLNGIDRRMVLEFYSRWKFIDESLSLLNAAATMGEEARVLIIKGPAVQQPINPDDFGFRKNPSAAFAQTKATCIYNNMMVEEYSKLHPKLSFCHMYPGLVNTPGFDTVAWWQKPLVFVAKLLFMIPPEESGQRLLFALLLPQFKNGGFWVDQYSEPAVAQKETQEVRDALVEHYKQEGKSQTLKVNSSQVGLESRRRIPNWSKQTPAKPSFAEVKAANAAAPWSYLPTGVFVGATSGVELQPTPAGAYSPIRLGHAQIIIIVRSRTRGEAILASLPKTSDSKYEFVTCDVSDPKNIVTAAKELSERLTGGKLNYLVMSQSVCPWGPPQPSLNGIDLRMVLDFYSRWKVVDEFLPILKNYEIYAIRNERKTQNYIRLSPFAISFRAW
ncbi:hypothetical protein M407DRAFT_19364 [Tulasnella calospora MUT 4182]|uniref:Ketoreductase (KR) domain-containing protein n=1 Tax=Tulasnella calospora MUT 4182 TaxID=1051891 RepID=A0A0C3MCW9_9AGAM|nr:hypothetical protein M407DRAFT_19364 [Tulasnella calospora MUT 4182]